VSDKLRKYLPIVPALLIFTWSAQHFDFLQDDAYITYRYVQNYLNGDGLVFNIGERIEGFTNFGWTVYLIAWGALNQDYIAISRVTGLLFGLGSVVLTYLISLIAFREEDKWFALLPTYLIGINLSLTYWSAAGLETAAFVFLAMLSVYLYLKRSWFLIATLALAVWVRPEGAVVTGILIVIEAMQTRRVPGFTLRCAAVALLVSLPFVFFKVLYYGSVFPNAFYAKTGFRLDHLTSGFEYTGRFFKHYPLYAVSLAAGLTLWFRRRLSSANLSLLLFTLFYMAYIVLIGGDVLKVHRFFLPLIGIGAIILVAALAEVLQKTHVRTRMLVLGVTALIALPMTYVLPEPYIAQYNMLEKRFTTKMAKMAIRIKESDSTDFSVALPTIGIFGYSLIGHEIIDMVGLTDSTIARHSEEPIPGMETTWKEKKHNTRYILTRAPDYILFSTGVKPSAPAERALLLYQAFVKSYHTVGWYFKIEETDRSGLVFAVFKRTHEITGDLIPYYPVEYVQHYKKGLDQYSSADYRGALPWFDRALKASPKPYNPYGFDRCCGRIRPCLRLIAICISMLLLTRIPPP